MSILTALLLYTLFTINFTSTSEVSNKLDHDLAFCRQSV